MNNKLRIVFMGTPLFALGVLQTLVKHLFSVVGVVSAPDKPAGRGQKRHSSPVSEYARIQNIPLAQPVSLKDPEFLSLLHLWNPHIIVVVAFRMLPQEVWSLPRLGTINLHASLLPQYRGAAPINHALIQGETITGVTTFLIDHQIDTGNILFQEPHAIHPDDTAGSLHNSLLILGSELVCRTLVALSEGSAKSHPQSQTSPLFLAPKINKEMCRIQWNNNPQTINNLIRGLSPSPAAFGLLGETFLVKIFKANPLIKEHLLPHGVIQSDQKTYLHVACQGGWLSITDLQMAGKKRMLIREFLQGFRNITRYRFS